MNRINLNLTVSDSRDLTYVVYRSENPEDLPASLDKLKDLQPVLEVDEASVSLTPLKISEELRVAVSDGEDGVVQYKLKNKCVKSDTFETELVIHFDLPNQIIRHETDTFVFTHNAGGSLTGVTRTKRDKSLELWGGSNLSDCPVKIEDDQLELPETYVDGALFVELFYTIHTIEVQDGTVNQVGVTYHGPEPHGLAVPDVSFKKNSLHLGNDSYAPLWHVADTDSRSRGRLYYYRIVAVQGEMVSQPSPLFAHELKQDPIAVRHILEISKDFHRAEEPTWEPLTILQKGEVAQIGMVKGVDYSRFGKPVEPDVPTFTPSDWQVDTKYAQSDNRIIVTLPNVWHKGDARFNRRFHLAYRLIAEYRGHKSEEGPVLTKEEKAHLPVERMVVIRRNVTGEVEAEQRRASLVNEGTVIKTYLRKNGVYHDNLLDRNLPVNIPKSTSPTDILTEGTIFKELVIEDVCLPGEAYNYTVYLYDAYGEKSVPVSRFVQV